MCRALHCMLVRAEHPPVVALRRLAADREDRISACLR